MNSVNIMIQTPSIMPSSSRIMKHSIRTRLARPRLLMAFLSLAPITIAIVDIQVHPAYGDLIKKSPPNVLLIMADDLGWKDLNCQDNPKLKTPNLNRLATQGVRFTDAYAAAPVCSPTRAALMTGQAPARLKITQHGPDIKAFWPEDRVIQPPPSSNELLHHHQTLAESLQARGYATGFFGKWHLGNAKEFWPTNHGFDVNVGGCGFGGPPTYFDPYRIPTLPPRREGEYLTDRLADETIDYIRSNRDTPMFVCLWTYNPHYPFEAPEDLIDSYRGKEGRGLKNAVYAAQLEATDRAIGRVLDELDNLQLRENTLVIFTSDNGGWSGATDNHPLNKGKGYLYEGGVRVPLIIRWPGRTSPNTTNATPVISMDLTASILEATIVAKENQDQHATKTDKNLIAAGELAVSPNPISKSSSPSTSTLDLAVDGVSLIPLLRGDSLDREEIFFHYPHFAFHRDNRPGSAIRRGKYKLILNYDDGSTELYDLDQDIGETTDLSESKPDLRESLLNSLITWLDSVDADRPTPIE